MQSVRNTPTSYGYGEFDGDYWFIGMEEGGSDDLSHRLSIWQERGSRTLEDIYQYHEKLGPNHWFGVGAKPQKTWSFLIRILLSMQGKDCTPEMMLKYQTEELGRYGHETALLELLPLPSLSTKEWKYEAYFGTRTQYRREYSPGRIQYLKDHIQANQPKAVIFYSMNWWYRKKWHEIAGTEQGFEIVPIGNERMLRKREGQTVYAIINHPAARFKGVGSTTNYFNEVGKVLRQTL